MRSPARIVLLPFTTFDLGAGVRAVGVIVLGAMVRVAIGGTLGVVVAAKGVATGGFDAGGFPPQPTKNSAITLNAVGEAKRDLLMVSPLDSSRVTLGEAAIARND